MVDGKNISAELVTAAGGTENGAVIEAMQELYGNELLELGGTKVLVLPKGQQLHSLKKFRDEYLPAPERREGTARHSELRSFIEHVTRFADEHSTVWANEAPTSPALLAVLDYHEKGSAGAPRFGKHRAHYHFPVSDEWKAWVLAATDKLEQAAFAEFLEEHIVDVIDPTTAGESTKAFAAQLDLKLASPSALMTLSRGLTVRVESKVAQHANLSTGEGQLHYEESHQGADGAPLKVPGGFVIGIPVFRGGAVYQLGVRLRYRVRSGKVTWTLAPGRPDAVFRDAFEEACATVHERTKLPVFFGTPE